MISCPLSGNKALNASRPLRKRLERKPLPNNNCSSLISTFALQMPLKRTSLYSPRCVTSLISAEPPEAPLTCSINTTGYTGLASSIINTHGVINLSSHILNEAEISLLSKGLSFCPCPGPLDLANAMSDLNEFHRSLRLAIHFQEMDAQVSSTDPQRGDHFSHRNFRVPSSWQSVLESFILSNYVAANKFPVLPKR